MMKKLKSAREHWEPVQSFTKIAVISLCVIVICSILTFSVVQDMIVEQCILSAAQQFEQIQREFDTLNEEINATATQIILDDFCSTWLVSGKSYDFDELDLRKIRRQLSNFLNVDNRIESIYMYNGMRMEFLSTDYAKVYPAEQFPDAQIRDIMNHYNEHFSRNLICRHIRSGTGPDRQDTVMYSYILSYAREQVVTNAIVINVTPAVLTSGILNTLAVDNSEVIVVDEKGNLWNKFSEMLFLDEEEALELVAELKDTDSGYRKFWREARPYFVSWKVSESSGWKFIKLSRWEQVFSPLDHLVLCEIAAMTIVVIAVLAVTLYGRFSMRSIKQKLDQQALTQKVARRIQNKTSGFLDEFLYQKKRFTQEDIVYGLKQSGFDIRDSTYFHLLLFSVDCGGAFRETDGYVLQATQRKCCRLLEEVLNRRFTARGLERRDGCIFLAAAEEPAALETFEELLRQFQTAAGALDDLAYNLILHTAGREIASIPEKVQELLSAVEQKFYCPVNTVLPYDALAATCGKGIDYWALDIEKTAEKICVGSDNFQVFSDFSARIAHCDSHDYHNTMVWLGIAVIKKWKELPYGDNVGADEWLVQLTACRRQSEMLQIFRQLCVRIQDCRASFKVNAKTSAKIGAIENHILENYADQNLSADSLSEKYGVTSNYLRRVFKAEVGMSVADYINEVRLQHVFERLETTREPIKQIADGCGFVSANHFYSFFKKKTGMTPSQYRMQFNAGLKL